MAEIQTSSWSEVAAANNAAPPDGAPEGMAYASVNNSMREMMAALKRAWNREHATVIATGTTDAMNVAFSVAPTALVSGMCFRFYSPAGFSSTVTNPTLEINTLGAKTIFKRDGLTALAVNDIRASTLYEMTYDGTNFRVHHTGV